MSVGNGQGWDEGPLAERLLQERIDAAQMEWERWKRVAGTVAIGLRQTARDIEHMANRLDIDAAAQRDLTRYAAIVRESAHELDGPNWLKSPKAMAALRAEGKGH